MAGYSHTWFDVVSGEPPYLNPQHPLHIWQRQNPTSRICTKCNQQFSQGFNVKVSSTIDVLMFCAFLFFPPLLFVGIIDISFWDDDNTPLILDERL